MLTTILDQTRTLRNLSKILRDIYNIIRFSICASNSLISRFNHINVISKRVFRRLIWSFSLLHQTSFRYLLIIIIAKTIVIVTITKIATITIIEIITIMTERTRLSSTRSTSSSRLLSTRLSLSRRLSSSLLSSSS